MNRGIIVGIIIAVLIGIGVTSMTVNYNESEENPDSIGVEEDSESKQYTITIREEMGFHENPP